MERKQFMQDARRNLIDNYSEDLNFRQLNIILEVFEDLGMLPPCYKDDRRTYWEWEKVDET